MIRLRNEDLKEKRKKKQPIVYLDIFEYRSLKKIKI